MNLSDEKYERKFDGRFNSRRLSEDELAEYDAQGFLVLDDLLTDMGLHEMVDQCMVSWRAEKGEFDPDAGAFPRRVGVHRVPPDLCLLPCRRRAVACGAVYAARTCPVGSPGS